MSITKVTCYLKVSVVDLYYFLFYFIRYWCFKSQIFSLLYVLDWFVETLDWLFVCRKIKPIQCILWIDTYIFDWPALYYALWLWSIFSLIINIILFVQKSAVLGLHLPGLFPQQDGSNCLLLLLGHCHGLGTNHLQVWHPCLVK